MLMEHNLNFDRLCKLEKWSNFGMWWTTIISFKQDNSHSKKVYN